VLLICFGRFLALVAVSPVNLKGEEITMSWLRKIVSTVCSSRVEQVVEGVVDAMPTSQCLTAEPALANGIGQEKKNPMEPRRYFVKPELVGATPTPQSFTAEPAVANGADHEDGNPTKQRRYFAKTGKWVDNEEELAARNGANGSEEVIFDRRPIDLRTLFPKLSLR
jgi:hypothetical protein